MDCEQVTFKIDGQDFKFEFRPPAQSRDSVFVFGLHKAGSVLLTKVVHEMADAVGLPVINVTTQAFIQGLSKDQIPKDIIGPIYMRDGYVFVGLRAFEHFLPVESLSGRRKVLLVRDPRDMLVSSYFSKRYSHTIPTIGRARIELLGKRSAASVMTIDDYVLSDQCSRILANYRNYNDVIDNNVISDWRVFRYEDIIFRKREWLRDMAVHLQLAVPDAQLDLIADSNDILPASEQPSAHIRQVRPGNHRQHLKPETIACLNESLADILTRHNYAIA